MYLCVLQGITPRRNGIFSIHEAQDASAQADTMELGKALLLAVRATLEETHHSARLP